MRLVYFIIGWVAVGLAFIGAFLPIIPTVPFLLVALWAFGNSSERLKQKLLSHPVFGPDIQRWQERGAIRPIAKTFSIFAMGVSVLITLAFQAPVWAVTTQALILGAVSVYILSRPSE
ncbi:MAG: YbaN family protein [Paracoccus sp. (in: a-proteobacteria)]